VSFIRRCSFKCDTPIIACIIELFLLPIASIHQNSKAKVSRKFNKLNFAYNAGKNTISNINTLLARVADTTERQPTSNTSCILAESKIAAQKPEVVITLLVIQIEMRSQMLLPSFQGSPTQLNVDRHRIPAASWCNPRWPPRNWK
jgi:hypothetical protein